MPLFTWDGALQIAETIFELDNFEFFRDSTIVRRFQESLNGKFIEFLGFSIWVDVTGPTYWTPAENISWNGSAWVLSTPGAYPDPDPRLTSTESFSEVYGFPNFIRFTSNNGNIQVTMYNTDGGEPHSEIGAGFIYDEEYNEDGDKLACTMDGNPYTYPLGILEFDDHDEGDTISKIEFSFGAFFGSLDVNWGISNYSSLLDETASIAIDSSGITHLIENSNGGKSHITTDGESFSEDVITTDDCRYALVNIVNDEPNFIFWNTEGATDYIQHAYKDGTWQLDNIVADSVAGTYITTSYFVDRINTSHYIYINTSQELKYVSKTLAGSWTSPVILRTLTDITPTYVHISATATKVYVTVWDTDSVYLYIKDGTWQTVETVFTDVSAHGSSITNETYENNIDEIITITGADYTGDDLGTIRIYKRTAVDTFSLLVDYEMPSQGWNRKNNDYSIIMTTTNKIRIIVGVNFENPQSYMLIGLLYSYPEETIELLTTTQYASYERTFRTPNQIISQEAFTTSRGEFFIRSGPLFWDENFEYFYTDERIQVQWGVDATPEEFVGNVFTVGTGPDPYDYATPLAAVAAASDGDIILIYPGTYNMAALWVITKNIILRGMGGSPTDVSLVRNVDGDSPNNAIELNVIGKDTKIMFENLQVIRDVSAAAGCSLSFNDATAYSNIYFNRCILRNSSSHSGGFGGITFNELYNFVDPYGYKGNFYGTNISIFNGSGYMLNAVGFGSETSIISCVDFETNSAALSSSERDPNPFSYIINSVGNFGTDSPYGYAFGSKLVKFLE